VAEKNIIKFLTDLDLSERTEIEVGWLQQDQFLKSFFSFSEASPHFQHEKVVTWPVLASLNGQINLCGFNWNWREFYRARTKLWIQLISTLKNDRGKLWTE